MSAGRWTQPQPCPGACGPCGQRRDSGAVLWGLGAPPRRLYVPEQLGSLRAELRKVTDGQSQRSVNCSVDGGGAGWSCARPPAWCSCRTAAGMGSIRVSPPRCSLPLSPADGAQPSAPPAQLPLRTRVQTEGESWPPSSRAQCLEGERDQGSSELSAGSSDWARRQVPKDTDPSRQS